MTVSLANSVGNKSWSIPGATNDLIHDLQVQIDEGRVMKARSEVFKVPFFALGEAARQGGKGTLELLWAVPLSAGALMGLTKGDPSYKLKKLAIKVLTALIYFIEAIATAAVLPLALLKPRILVPIHGMLGLDYRAPEVAKAPEPSSVTELSPLERMQAALQKVVTFGVDFSKLVLSGKDPALTVKVVTVIAAVAAAGVAYYAASNSEQVKNIDTGKGPNGGDSSNDGKRKSEINQENQNKGASNNGGGTAPQNDSTSNNQHKSPSPSTTPPPFINNNTPSSLNESTNNGTNTTNTSLELNGDTATLFGTISLVGLVVIGGLLFCCCLRPNKKGGGLGGVLPRQN